MRTAALHSSAYDGTPGKVESAGVDWLTTTAIERADANDLGRLAETIIRSQRRAGNDVKPWRWNRYQGSIVAGCAAGTRDDSLIVRLSGECAREWWKEAYQITGRATRLDVQATFTGLPAGCDLAGWHTWQVDRHTPKTGRPSEWTYVQSKSTGATLYIGARTSQRFYRCYDKGAEEGEGHLTGRWRYELELKEEAAKLCATLLLERRSDRVTAMSLLHREFSSKGVTPPFRRMGRTPPIAPRTEPTDDDRRLRWLAEQVSRTVAGLIANGHERAVYEALRLPAPSSEVT